MILQQRTEPAIYSHTHHCIHHILVVLHYKSLLITYKLLSTILLKMSTSIITFVTRICGKIPILSNESKKN